MLLHNVERAHCARKLSAVEVICFSEIRVQAVTRLISRQTPELLRGRLALAVGYLLIIACYFSILADVLRFLQTARLVAYYGLRLLRAADASCVGLAFLLSDEAAVVGVEQVASEELALVQQ